MKHIKHFAQMFVFLLCILGMSFVIVRVMEWLSANTLPEVQGAFVLFILFAAASAGYAFLTKEDK
jgi:hypothetical protein